jgi:hypothetical protein
VPLVEVWKSDSGDYALADAWAHRLTPGIFAALADLKGSPVTELASLLLAAAERELGRLGVEKIKRGPLVTSRKPLAEEWARERAGTKIKAIDAGTREKIRDIIATNIERKQSPTWWHPSDKVKRRIEREISLLPRERAAVRNLARQLADKDLPEGTIERRSEQYADRLLAARAERIARTEAVAAEAQGRLEAWRVAADAGLLKATARRRWIQSFDPCEICRELDHKETTLDGQYRSAFVGLVEAPPAHPQCRCVEEIIE